MKSFKLDSLAKDILLYLNNNSKVLLSVSLNSPRAVGDAVQTEIAERAMPEVLQEFGVSVKDDFSRRSMEDLAFSFNNRYYAIDVKTHNLDTDFNMPNLISVRRLAQFYKNDDRNHFCLLIVSYKVRNGEIAYQDCFFKPIEWFDWKCLTIGALGWGQIQIANANNLIFHQYQRKDWMLELCQKVEMFYDEEIGKIGERKSWFAQTRDYWLNK